MVDGYQMCDKGVMVIAHNILPFGTIALLDISDIQGVTVGYIGNNGISAAGAKDLADAIGKDRGPTALIMCKI